MRAIAAAGLVLATAPMMMVDAALADRIGALTRPFKGTVVLYAKNLRTGRDFGLGADTKVRTASTIKLPVLCALESLVAAGRVRWDERLPLRPEEKVTGSGVVGSLEDGTDLTAFGYLQDFGRGVQPYISAIKATKQGIYLDVG